MYEYPYGNGQQLNLDWFLTEWKNLLAAWEAEKNGIDGAMQAEIDRAEAALADVFAARDAAAQSAANALESKNAAAQSASDASGYLATVRADANTASNAAQNAAQSESNAAESAQTAVASKNAAGQSERNAAQSEANANSSKNAAAQSAADALAHKDAAAQSAADALANKNAAAQSAEDASDAAASVEASAQQIATNTSDIVNLKESLNNKAPVIVNNASGEIAHFVDGANNVPIKSLMIDGAESGNVIRTGKNLLNLNKNVSVLTGSVPSAVIISNAEGTATITENYYNRDNNKFGWEFKVAKNKICSLSGYYQSDTACTIRIYTSDGSVLFQYNIPQNKTFALTFNTGENTELYFYATIAGWGQTIILNTVQIEFGNTATAYQVYDGNEFEYPTDLITTVYGVNNIWCDDGNINVVYCADTKLYIDNKITELQATMLENIGG